MINKFDNIFYVYSFNAIGGVESWIYYLVKKYAKDHNILVVYSDSKSSKEQISRISKYATIIKDNGNIKYKCKNVYYCYWQNILDRVEADEYIYVCHADVRKCKEELRYGFVPYRKTTKMLSVSNLAKDSLKETYGYDSVVCHNPVEIEEKDEPLLLISATRLTVEKGYKNMQKLGRMLDNSGIPYLWVVFSNRIKEKPAKKMVFLDPELDISSYIKKADYLVQLSKWESDGLSPKEAMKLGTKVIVSDIPAFHEAGIVEGKNGYYFSDNIDLKEIYKNKDRKIEYNPPKDEWNEHLYKSKPIKNIKYKVKAIMNFTYGYKLDFEYKQTQDNKIRIGDIFYCDKDQYSYFTGNNIHNNIVVELVDIEKSEDNAI